MPSLQIDKSPHDWLHKEDRATPQIQEARKLPLVAHLEEIRRRLLICLAAVACGTIVSFRWVGGIIQWLKRPAGETLPRLAFFTPAEGLLAYFKVATLAGLFLAMPILLYQIWAFLRPGLSGRERRFGMAFIGWGSLLFLAGIAFAYSALLPAALHFLLSFGSDSLVPVISISRYLDFVIALLFAVGSVFELPLAVFLLAKLGVITPRLLLRKWRFIMVGITVAAAFLTPTPDVVNMVLLMVPMFLLYGISIGVSWFAVPKKGMAR